MFTTFLKPTLISNTINIENSTNLIIDQLFYYPCTHSQTCFHLYCNTQQGLVVNHLPCFQHICFHLHTVSLLFHAISYFYILLRKIFRLGWNFYRRNRVRYINRWRKWMQMLLRIVYNINLFLFLVTIIIKFKQILTSNLINLHYFNFHNEFW